MCKNWRKVVGQGRENVIEREEIFENLAVGTCTQICECTNSVNKSVKKLKENKIVKNHRVKFEENKRICDHRVRKNCWEFHPRTKCNLNMKRGTVLIS